MVCVNHFFHSCEILCRICWTYPYYIAAISHICITTNRNAPLSVNFRFFVPWLLFFIFCLESLQLALCFTSYTLAFSYPSKVDIYYLITSLLVLLLGCFAPATLHCSFIAVCHSISDVTRFAMRSLPNFFVSCSLPCFAFCLLPWFKLIFQYLRDRSTLLITCLSMLHLYLSVHVSLMYSSISVGTVRLPLFFVVRYKTRDKHVAIFSLRLSCTAQECF